MPNWLKKIGLRKYYDDDDAKFKMIGNPNLSNEKDTSGENNNNQYFEDTQTGHTDYRQGVNNNSTSGTPLKVFGDRMTLGPEIEKLGPPQALIRQSDGNILYKTSRTTVVVPEVRVNITRLSDRVTKKLLPNASTILGMNEPELSAFEDHNYFSKDVNQFKEGLKLATSDSDAKTIMKNQSMLTRRQLEKMRKQNADAESNKVELKEEVTISKLSFEGEELRAGNNTQLACFDQKAGGVAMDGIHGTNNKNTLSETQVGSKNHKVIEGTTKMVLRSQIKKFGPPKTLTRQNDGSILYKSSRRTVVLPEIQLNITRLIDIRIEPFLLYLPNTFSEIKAPEWSLQDHNYCLNEEVNNDMEQN